MFNKDHSDGVIVLGFFVSLTLGMWLGFSMGTGGACNVRATLPLFAEQLYITFMGERN